MEDANNELIYFSNQNDKMEEAIYKAKKTFKYFWRELYWEKRRMIPALDLAIVKVPFVQKVKGENEPVVEHMWINEIQYDGEIINGVLVNKPNNLTNIMFGDDVRVKLNDISDWMFCIDGQTYGGYTIQVLRGEMDESERADHDIEWRLNFGDFNDVLVAYKQNEHPEYLIEHPMSIIMKEKINQYFKEHKKLVNKTDERGNTQLHIEAVAGNKSVIEILLENGADKNIKNNKGKTPFNYAQEMNWEHIKELLE